MFNFNFYILDQQATPNIYVNGNKTSCGKELELSLKNADSFCSLESYYSDQTIVYGSMKNSFAMQNATTCLYTYEVYAPLKEGMTCSALNQTRSCSISFVGELHTGNKGWLI